MTTSDIVLPISEPIKPYELIITVKLCMPLSIHSIEICMKLGTDYDINITKCIRNSSQQYKI